MNLHISVARWSLGALAVASVYTSLSPPTRARAQAVPAEGVVHALPALAAPTLGHWAVYRRSAKGERAEVTLHGGVRRGRPAGWRLRIVAPGVWQERPPPDVALSSGWEALSLRSLALAGRALDLPLQRLRYRECSGPSPPKPAVSEPPGPRASGVASASAPAPSAAAICVDAVYEGPAPTLGGLGRRLEVALRVSPKEPGLGALTWARVTDSLAIGGGSLREVIELQLLRHGGAAQWRREERRYRAR